MAHQPVPNGTPLQNSLGSINRNGRRPK
jgi:hypothetical protein